jgi:hypothetical protein
MQFVVVANSTAEEYVYVTQLDSGVRLENEASFIPTCFLDKYSNCGQPTREFRFILYIDKFYKQQYAISG